MPSAARNLGLNLTGRLTHAQVEQIAEAWFPEIRFHEKERYHPIDLERMFTDPAGRSRHNSGAGAPSVSRRCVRSDWRTASRAARGPQLDPTSSSTATSRPMR